MIIINDIFYFIQDVYICNFAGDYPLYSIKDNFEEVKIMLKMNFELLQESHGPKSRKMPLLNNN